MQYSKLNLKINQAESILTKGQEEIHIKHYISLKDKKDLVEIALQKSEQNSMYNEMLLDMYFNLYTVFIYTDLFFEEEERNDEFKLYDELHSSGLLTEIISKIPEDEYASLVSYLEIMRNNHDSYGRSAAGVIRMFIQDLPQNAQAASKILENFNKEDYQNVINFAEAANGNRPIPAITNKDVDKTEE